MLDRIKSWFASEQTSPEHGYDGEGQFFEAGEHAELIQKILGRVGIRANVRDFADDKGKLVITIDDVRVTSERDLDASDWCDTGPVLAALNLAADRYGWKYRFSNLPTNDQCERLAALPIDFLRTRRSEIELSLPFRDITIAKAGDLEIPDGMTCDASGNIAFVEPALCVEAREIRLREPTRIENVLVCDRARFDLRGHLAGGTLAEDARLGPCLAKSGTEFTLGFRLPESLTLAEAWTVAGIELPAGTKVVFWERTIDNIDTPIASATIPKEMVVRGRTLARGTEIEFTEQGELSHAFVGDETIDF